MKVAALLGQALLTVSAIGVPVAENHGEHGPDGLGERVNLRHLTRPNAPMSWCRYRTRFCPRTSLSSRHQIPSRRMTRTRSTATTGAAPCTCRRPPAAGSPR